MCCLSEPENLDLEPLPEPAIKPNDSISHHRTVNRLGHLLQHDGIQREVDARGNLLKETFPQGFAIESSYGALPLFLPVGSMMREIGL